MSVDIVELFCFVDDFLINLPSKFDTAKGCKVKPGPKPRFQMTEIVTIVLYFQLPNYDCFKNYYEQKILIEYKTYFKFVSYSHFVTLMKQALPAIILIMNALLKPCDDVSFVDSTSVSVCKNYRISAHKVFKYFAKLGKTTKGWFFGFKLHLIISSSGNLVKVMFSAGNIDDRKALEKMTKGISGKLFGDRGYISKALTETLINRGIQLITRTKKNMKKMLMDIKDRIMLSKRSLIETVIGKIKLLGKFEHSRHRSVTNAFIHMIASLINYQLQPNKPSIKSFTETLA